MHIPDISKPLIKAGWLRALIFVVIFMLLSGTAFLMLFPELFYTKAESTLDSLIQGRRLMIYTLVLFSLSFILTYVFRRWVDKKTFISLGFQLKGYLSEALAGASMGIFIITASSIILKITDHLKWTDIIFDPRTLFLALGTIALAAIGEELVFRGYLLSNLLSSLSRWPAILISAALFMTFHWSLNGFFPLINTFIMGLILGLNYSYTRNLWFSVCLHIGWNFLMGPVLGLAGSGSEQTLLQADLMGNENATGVAAGLEGSYILLTVSLLSLLLLFVFLQKKFNPLSQPAPGQK